MNLQYVQYIQIFTQYFNNMQCTGNWTGPRGAIKLRQAHFWSQSHFNNRNYGGKLRLEITNELVFSNNIIKTKITWHSWLHLWNLSSIQSPSSLRLLWCGPFIVRYPLQTVWINGSIVCGSLGFLLQEIFDQILSLKY